MKVLIISKLLPSTTGVSGAAIVFHRIRHLVAMGCKVDVLTFTPTETTGKAGTEELLSLINRLELLPAPKEKPLEAYLSFFQAVPYPFNLVTSQAMAKMAGQMLQAERYQIAIAEFSEMGQYLFGNPHLSAVRKIVACHECRTAAWKRAIRLHLWRYDGLTKRLYFNRLKKYEFSMYSNMDHVIALTSQERHDMLKYAPNLMVSVVPPGIKPGATLKRDKTATRSLLFIGCYAHEANRDAVRWFAKAVWPRLKIRYPDLIFYVVGYGTTPDIRDLGRRDASIVVTGAVKDLQPYLSKAAVFVCPLRMGGGFHLKNLEAMAAGVPIVSTSIGAAGIPSWDGESILLADTARQFVRSIGILLDDPDIGHNLSVNARSLVTRRFTEANEKAVLERVLLEVAAGQR